MASLMQAQVHARRNSNSGISQDGKGLVKPDEAPEGPRNDCEGLLKIFNENKVLSCMLFVATPLGFTSHYRGWDPPYIFIFNFIAIIPLAWIIGKATEDVAAKAGQTLGGLLNASFGNVVEMLLCVSGIRNDEIEVVQCTLVGSILSNLLLVMGCAFLAGGMFYAIQEFNQSGAQIQCSLMSMSVLSIGLPTVYVNVLPQEVEWEHMVQVSRWASLLLLSIYAMYLVFQLRTHADLFQDEAGDEEEEPPDLTAPAAAVLLGVATIVTSFAADFLIDALDSTVNSWNLSKEFVGIIMLPIIGNAAEHYTAITVAMRNKMDLSLGVAAGSSCQMALLVTPFTVIVGWYYGKEMTLNFHFFQLAVLLFVVFIVTTILSTGRTESASGSTLIGKSNWFQGYVLLVTYFVLGLIYFFEGSGPKSSLSHLD